MIGSIDLKALASRLENFESLAMIRKVISTNAIGRRVMIECIDGDLPLPKAVIVAREQTGGRGRGERTWHSPDGTGIYATILHARPLDEVALFPLEIAVGLATFLRETWSVDARVKWPNDVLVGGSKIAGILIEGRNHDGESYLVVGIGLNVLTLGPDAPPIATSIVDASKHETVDIAVATQAFIEFFDRWLARTHDRTETLEGWRALTMHQRGDSIECLVNDEIIRGTWEGIDEHGRAILKQGANSVTIAAGDLITRGDAE